MQITKSKIWWLLIVLVAVLVIYILKFADHYPFRQDLEHRPDFFGVTFSTKFCDELGLDWQETYTAILDELQAKQIRIPVYWDEIEKIEGAYDFSKYDYLIEEGSKRGVNFILSVGRRVPRWPECHSPAWLNLKDQEAIHNDTLLTIRAIVERYRDNPSVEYWQVENEPFLGSFGVCPPLDEDFLRQEFDLVRSLDSREVIITGSGELSWWHREAAIGDIFGSTLYRVVYNSWFGYLRFPLPVSYYRLKARLAGLSPDRLMVMELQAEPWVPQGKMTYLTSDQIDRSMSLDQFKANLQYSIDLDFRRTYIWGVEWWYWQKKYGNPEYWRIATRLFK
ncbi:MAG: hypothetical protein WC456_03445 [Patescibacteria group bacterium]